MKTRSNKLVCSGNMLRIGPEVAIAPSTVRKVQSVELSESPLIPPHSEPPLGKRIQGEAGDRSAIGHVVEHYTTIRVASRAYNQQIA
jgi:hypothetical protein